MSHTPGPWIDERHDGAGCVIIDQAAPKGYGRVGIAVVRRASNADIEVVSNARLIAAAPDLLIALERARDAMCAEDESDLEDWRDVLAQIEAALRKAQLA